MQNMERRTFEISELNIEVREESKPKIKGYAAVFNKLSENLGGFFEKIDPGAFTNSISKDDIRALFNHDTNYILGRTKSGTLTLAEDEKGLSIEIDPPDTTYAHDLQESIKRGDISQMSFGFTVIKDMWEFMTGKDPVRTLQEVKLFDVSPVVFPAYPQTSVKVRDYLKTVKEAEAQLDVEGAVASQSVRGLKMRKRILEL